MDADDLPEIGDSAVDEMLLCDQMEQFTDLSRTKRQLPACHIVE